MGATFVKVILLNFKHKNITMYAHARVVHAIIINYITLEFAVNNYFITSQLKFLHIYTAYKMKYVVIFKY